MKTYVVLVEGITQRKSADKASPDYGVMLQRKVGDVIELSDLAALDHEEEDLVVVDGVESRAKRLVPGWVSRGYVRPSGEPATAPKPEVKVRPSRRTGDVTREEGE